ncbi:unnamed protein product, partial [Timema podura]|nr:unnamed protein product [Timema podura]
HPTKIRTSISPSWAVELNTTSALANFTTEAGNTNIVTLLVRRGIIGLSSLVGAGEERDQNRIVCDSDQVKSQPLGQIISHKMKPCSPQLLPVTVVLATLFLGSVLSLKKEDCEVCITVVERFSNSLSPEVKSDTKKIENEFRDFCKALKNKENRFCYYLGGMEDSATGILGELSKPLSWSLPADKICEKLKKMDNQICDLRYDKTIDLKTVELKKLKVRDLRKILNDWDEVCEGCIEKTDFIKRIEELKPLYVREEL